MTVMVVHPQVQHSRKLVRALLRYGILESFVTSVFVQPRFAGILPASLAAKYQGRYDPAIPVEKVRTFPLFELIWQLAVRYLKFLPLNRLLYYNLWSFDLVVSWIVAASPAKIVVGYENAALHLFRQARRRGRLCVLDAASVHYKCQESPSGMFPRRLQEKINARKDEEIRLADRILVLSHYARETFVANGVNKEKLTVIPLGIDSQVFTPAESATCTEKEGFTFLFVGNVTFNKGVDLLFQAFNDADVPGKRLVVVGAPGDASKLLRVPVAGIEVKGHIPHDQLVDIYRQADVFVLPSRLDGFGMVVTEAMATGLPVIVSTRVGAKDLVGDGENGWIFESGNSDDLKNKMEHAFLSRARLPAFGLNARAAVTAYSWEHYQDVVGDYFSRLLELQNYHGDRV